MLWIKAFHIILVVTWFSGLFYLPRLFVNHAMTEDPNTIATLKVMERKLFRFTTGLAAFAVGFGSYLAITYWDAYAHQKWLHIKLGLVILLIAYHISCHHFTKVFAEDRNTHSHKYYRIYNEIPVFLLFSIVILAVVRPF
jgi:putative membrane protein